MLYAIVAVLALLLDQAVKYYVTLQIDLNTGVQPLIPKVVSLMNIHNTGAAFSMFSGGGARWLFVILAVAITIAVVWALAKQKVKSPLARWMLVLVAAGALGNAIDRALYGYVVDMFKLEFWKNFAVFNVADIFITVPGVILCIAICLQPEDEEKSTKFVLSSRKKSVKPLKMEPKAEPETVYENPFAPAEPAAAPEQAETPAAEPQPKEKTAEEQLAGLTVDDILKELK